MWLKIQNSGITGMYGDIKVFSFFLLTLKLFTGSGWNLPLKSTQVLLRTEGAFSLFCRQWLKQGSTRLNSSGACGEKSFLEFSSFWKHLHSWPPSLYLLEASQDARTVGYRQ